MRLNLDANATFGLHPVVAAELRDLLPRLEDELLNPSAVHRGGQASKLMLDQARDEVRALVGAAANDTVIFTSGATEANNQIVLAPFLAMLSAPTFDRSAFGLVASAVEHESVIDAAKIVAGLGFPVSFVAPKRSRGWYESADILAAITPNTKILSVIHGQNEIGTLMPIREIALGARAQAPQILIHSDIVQTAGRVPVDLTELGVDALTLSGHKLGALAGIGALVVRAEAASRIVPLLAGGAQQNRLRAGTENIIGAISLGIAARVARLDTERGARMENARRALRAAVLELVPEAVVQGEFAEQGEVARLPNTVCFTFPKHLNVQGADLVVALDLAGVCISTGAACNSGKQEGIRTLAALGFSEDEAKRSIRISLTGAESATQMEMVAQRIARSVNLSRGERIGADRYAA
jgi:cysteine desulfurase